MQSSLLRKDKVMKRILIVATGGTIAGVGEVGKSASYQAGEINIDEIIESIPALKHLAHLSAIQLFNVDSNEMDEAKLIKLANELNVLLARDDVDGIVVTHGTDTLDETAYFLNLTLKTYKPVILTGAMRPATATSADGPMNLYQAVALACDDQALGHGVMAVFSDTIYSGRDIQKVNNFKTDAFDKKDFGCLGYMRDDQVYFFARTFKKHTLMSIFSEQELTTLPKVGIAYYYGGASTDVLDALALTCKGIVIAGSGSGNYSKKWIEKVEELVNKGIIIVRSSRVGHGIVFESSVFDPKNLTIPSNTLSSQKARILLMLALSKTNDKQQINEWFNEY